MKTPIEKLLEIITLKEKENAIILIPIIDKIDIDNLISEEKQLQKENTKFKERVEELECDNNKFLSCNYCGCEDIRKD